MAASITEIAKEAGVSRSLVSRLVNNDQTLRISEKTRREILATSEKLGGVKHRIPKKCRQGTVVLPVNAAIRSGPAAEDVTSRYIHNVVAEAVAANKLHFSIMPFQEDQKLDFFQHICSMPTSIRQGIFLSTSVVDSSIAKLLLETKVPHVCIDSAAERYGINTVDAYALSGYRKAISHLQELGHTRIGFLGPQRMNYSAFVTAMHEAGLPCKDEFNCHFSVPPKGNRGKQYCHLANDLFGKWIDNGGSATAILCHQDFIAFGAIEAMQQRGLIPGIDISLIGFDNLEGHIDKFDTPAPELTTIDYPRKAVYNRAVKILEQQILHGYDNIIHEHLAIDLILRKTTGKPPIK